MDEEDVVESQVTHEQSFFADKQQVMELIMQLCCEEVPTQRELFLEKLEKLLIKYQEQPQLLGPHVESLMEPINRQLETLLLRSEQLLQKVSNRDKLMDNGSFDFLI